MPWDPAFEPYGDIRARWLDMGGGGGALGAPRGPEVDLARAKHGLPAPRVQHFERGTIGWHPAQGHHMTTVIWQVDQEHASFMWGLTDPYSYDKFVVRWDPGTGWTQADIAQHHTWGTLERQGLPPGIGVTPWIFHLQVEGRDNGPFGIGVGESKQGWTDPITYRMR